MYAILKKIIMHNEYFYLMYFNCVAKGMKQVKVIVQNSDFALLHMDLKIMPYGISPHFLCCIYVSVKYYNLL